MSELILVDTDVLIDVARSSAEAIAVLAQIEQRAPLAVSVITQMELVVGCRNKAELRAVDHFLKRFEVVRLNERISDQAVDLLRRYRLSHGLLIADAIVAASALSLDRPFVSKNQRDYAFIPELQLLPYPEPFTR